MSFLTLLNEQSACRCSSEDLRRIHLFGLQGRQHVLSRCGGKSLHPRVFQVVVLVPIPPLTSTILLYLRSALESGFKRFKTGRQLVHQGHRKATLGGERITCGHLLKRPTAGKSATHILRWAGTSTGVHHLQPTDLRVSLTKLMIARGPVAGRDHIIGKAQG